MSKHITWSKRQRLPNLNYTKNYNRIISILIKFGSFLLPDSSTTSIGRLPNCADQHLHGIFSCPICHDSIGRPWSCASFGFFQIGNLSFTISPSLTHVKKWCQHMPPSFGIIYFVPKLFQPAFKAIPCTPCTQLTPCNWVKLFFAPGLSPSARTNPTRRFTFRLFTYPDWAINITFRPCIGNKSPLATEPPFFFL